MPGWAAELAYCLEQHFHITGILSKDTAFQHQGVPFIGAVAYFAQTVDALVGIDANDGGAADVLDNAVPHIGDLQVGRAGIAADLLRALGDDVFDGGHCGGAAESDAAQDGSFEEGPAAGHGSFREIMRGCRDGGLGIFQPQLCQEFLRRCHSYYFYRLRVNVAAAGRRRP